MSALNNVVEIAFRAGVLRERARIYSIMALPGADANPAFAWQLVVDGFSCEAAQAAIAVERLASAPAATAVRH
jgi:hypothetical protein